MTCIKQKKFLFFKWKEVHHNYKMKFISKFMSTSITFHVDYQCQECGAIKTEKFVEQDELILAGISVDDLQKIDGRFNIHEVL